MPAPQSWIAAYRTCAPSPTWISVIASLKARVRSGEAYRSMKVTSAPASTTISVWGNTAAPSTSTYVSVCSGRSTLVSRGTYRNVPPVRNAACSAVNRVRFVGTRSWR